MRYRVRLTLVFSYLKSIHETTVNIYTFSDMVTHKVLCEAPQGSLLGPLITVLNAKGSQKKLQQCLMGVLAWMTRAQSEN